MLRCSVSDTAQVYTGGGEGGGGDRQAQGAPTAGEGWGVPRPARPDQSLSADDRSQLLVRTGQDRTGQAQPDQSVG